MKKLLLHLLSVAVLCVSQATFVLAATPPLQNILISEIQTGGAQDATEEFVELYNPNDVSVDVTGWQLQYRAASQTAAQTWPGSTTKATIACTAGSAAGCTVQIDPQGRLVLVHTIANIAGALPMTGGFSASGGEIRLIQPTSPITVQDYVGYGTAADAEGASAAPAPAPGQTIKRKITTDDTIIDTDVNSADFIASCGNPTPGAADSALLPYSTGCAAPPSKPSATGTTAPSDPPTDVAPSDSATPPADNSPPTDGSSPTDASASTGAAESNPPLTYLPILITEVLPNPAAPQQDSTDEFIELYNPSDTTVTLANYTLQTGTNWYYHFTLGDTPLGPHAYLAIYSAVSNLSLANTGSGVRLIDPSGAVAYEAPDYGTAKEGQSWMQDDSGWHWTLTPTPNAPNILTVPAPKITTPAPSVGTVKKKGAAARTVSAKLTAPKSPKAPSAKKATSSPTQKNATQSASTTQDPQIWLLAPIGALAIGYAVYEYRTDIARAMRKIRAKVTGKNKSTADAGLEQTT